MQFKKRIDNMIIGHIYIKLIECQANLKNEDAEIVGVNFLLFILSCMIDKKTQIK